jgi:NADH:ubiquinone oxidoreductase subunit F (NADH-binding)
MSRGLHLAETGRQDDFAAGLLPVGSFVYPPIAADRYADCAQTEDLTAHEARFGARPSAAGSSGGVLLGMLDEANLTGHGGGHFPVVRKWHTALRAGGGGVLIVNAAESEPGSAKDRALLATVPHLVLDGLACASETLGSQECVIWLHESAVDARRAVSRALTERHNAGLPELAVRLELAPDRYLSGESSALLQALSGGPALPTFTVSPAAESGYRGRPAIIHNVETLARIALLARTGVRRYPRTALVTVSTPAGRTVLEVADTATLADAVHAGGWQGTNPQAVLVGGYGGSWLSWSAAAPIRLCENDLKAAGASLGAGVLLPLSASQCGVARTAEITRFLAGASARQCGPCRFGLPDLAARLTALAVGKARRDEVDQLMRLTALINGRGGCHHPDGTVRMVATALSVFADDVALHARGRRCAIEQRSLVEVR